LLARVVPGLEGGEVLELGDAALRIVPRRGGAQRLQQLAEVRMVLAQLGDDGAAEALLLEEGKELFVLVADVREQFLAQREEMGQVAGPVAAARRVDGRGELSIEREMQVVEGCGVGVHGSAPWQPGAQAPVMWVKPAPR